jgi:ribonuclease D
MKNNITTHKGDLPNDLTLVGDIAVDTETLGLHPLRDPLCLVQLADAQGSVHLVQLDRHNYDAPNLKTLLTDEQRVKIFHFARFDLATLKHYLDVWATPVYCTKIASRLARTYSDRHGLKELCRELLSVDLSKQQQSSDWGAEELTQAQKHYAASDVLYLHQCREKLDGMLVREDRDAFARTCFQFLKTRVALDLAGWEQDDIFAH